MQKHWDIMRTDDAGDSWQEVSGNLPSDFGFPIDIHAHEPETIYVVPIKSDSLHYPPDGKLRVYRSRTGGNEWEELTKGLPQSDCYVNVLRDAMSVDSLDQCGVYFGTTGGQVYGSNDAGDNVECDRARSAGGSFGRGANVEMRISSTKPQTPRKFQASSFKRLRERFDDWRLGFGVSLVLGVWDLGFAKMIRVVLPHHLRTLARVSDEVQFELNGKITPRAIIDAIEKEYPMLRGTIRDHVTQARRPLVRFFACGEDVSHESPDTALPDAVANGAEPFFIMGAIAGG